MTDFVEAARSQLAKWLTSELHPAFSPEMLDEFPQARRELKLPSIAVQAIGDPVVEAYAPHEHEVTETYEQFGLVLYSYGSVTLDMQLDLWAKTPADRNKLTTAVSDALNTHPVYSLPLPDALAEYRRNPGLVLKLPDFYDILADYDFEQVTAPRESGDAAQTHEYRSVFVGSCEFHCVTMEQVALIKKIIVTTKLNDGTSSTRIIT